MRRYTPLLTLHVWAATVLLGVALEGNLQAV
jgi:hypothetical protein